MSDQTRSPILSLRRAKKESDRPDYSEPDFSSWAARLDSYVPPAQAAGAQAAVVVEAAPEPAPVPVVEETLTVLAAAPVAAPVVAVEVAPAEPEVAERQSLNEVLESLLVFDGAMCIALVDSESGMILGQAGSGVDMELAAAGASVILRARLASTRALGNIEKIDDVLISLTSQIQIIHPLPNHPSIFTYLIGDKAKSSLAMARYKATEADLQIQL